MSFLPGVYDALKPQCLRTMSKLEFDSVTMNETKRTSFAMMRKLSNNKFTLWGALTEWAKILDPRMSTYSVTSETKERFCTLLISHYGLSVSASESNAEKKDYAGLSIFLDAARTIRKDSHTQK